MEQGVVLTDDKDRICEIMTGDGGPVIHGGHLLFDGQFGLISNLRGIRRFQYA